MITIIRFLFICFTAAILSRTAISYNCGTCNGHGTCSITTGQCSCFQGYLGYQCEFRKCPTGAAWSDYATATDTAHASAECSNMGICDRKDGLCTCKAGFEGVACERMSCPACLNGRCISLREAAGYKDDRFFFYSTTYDIWDADKIYGCYCDYGWTGHKCQIRECPKGDDPMTGGQVNEIQHINCICNGCTGSFALSMRGQLSVNIDPSASLATIKSAIEGIKGVNTVTAVLSGAGSTVCDADGAVVTVTFTHNPGNLPALAVYDNLSGGTVTVTTGGGMGSYDTTVASVEGTREYVDCSNHGVCDSGSGVCLCDSNFASSDGAGGSGNLGDCGYGTTTACPTTSNGVCDLHGTCDTSGGTWACSCNAGYTGHDCSKRTCPTGYAWWDEPTASNTAHALAVCSNRGECITKDGTCFCDTGFTGSACELLSCPGKVACSSHGTCKTMYELATASSLNGELLGVTYGTTMNKAETWDYNKIQGCDCSQGYYMGPYIGTISDSQAYDCSLYDPDSTTTRVDEVQSLSCTADGGTFTMSFRQQTTSSISYSATAADLKAALESLSSITTVDVAIGSGSTVCAATAVATSITFTYEQGDVPTLTATSTSLTLTASTAAISVSTTTTGTKANLECSRRGYCNRDKGQCVCYQGYLSSDGNGNPGTRGDCGHRAAYITLS